jgi:hypothetical protein
VDEDALGNLLNYNIYRTRLSRVGRHPSPPAESGTYKVASHGLPSRPSLGDEVDKRGLIARLSLVWWHKGAHGVRRIVNPDNGYIISFFLFEGLLFAMH